MACWQAYAWGWAAPAVRVEARRVQRTPAKGQTYVRETDPGVKIISGGGAAASTKEKRTMSQDINIKLDRGPDNHVYTIIGTLLACGAVGMAAWAISNAGMLDLAATGLTVFFFQLVQVMMKVGLITLPERKSTDFQQTSGLLKTAWREFQEFQGRSPIWRMALLALGFTVGYMIFRWGLSVALGIFSNVWIAGAASALIASFIVAPQLFTNLVSKMKTKSGLQVKTTTGTPDAERGDV